MGWVNMRIPGSRVLSRRVVISCGPASQLGQLGYRLGDWIEHGQQAAPATVAGVEPYIAGYLEGAARVGRRWGTVAGIAVGLTVGTLIAVAAWIGAALS